MNDHEHPRLHEWAMAAGLANVECEEAEIRPFLQRFAMLVLEGAAKVALSHVDPDWPSDDLSCQAEAISSEIRALGDEEVKP